MKKTWLKRALNYILLSKKYVVKDIYRYSETMNPAISIGTASLKKSNGFNFYVIHNNSFKVTEVIKESL